MFNPVSNPFTKITLSVLLLTITSGVFGCYNEYTQRNLAGDSTTYDHEALPQFFKSFDRAFSEKYLAAHPMSALAADDYKTRSDIAVHLCRLGRYQEALAIFRNLYKRYPEEYRILANLGTTYELMGKPDSALTLLRKANKINPKSHGGTEWVHLRILEAKLKIQKDPTWLLHHQVLHLGIAHASGNDSDKFWNNFDAISAVFHQLEERIPFTPAPDLLIANILNEIAESTALEHSITEGYILYHIGLQYDPQDRYGIKNKMKNLGELFKKYNIEHVPDHKTLEHHFPPAESVIQYSSATYGTHHEEAAGLRALEAAAEGAPWYYWLGGAILLSGLGFYLFTRA